MRIPDWGELGPLPLQSFQFAAEEIDTDARHVLKGIRVLARDKTDHRLLHHQPVDESGGDYTGAFLWLPQAEGVGDPKRFESGWRHAWPVVIRTKPNENRLNDTTGNEHADLQDSVKAFPIFDKDLEEDLRFAHEIPFLGTDPKCRAVPAGGMRGIVLDSMHENKQEPIFFFGDGRIVAPHRGKDKPKSGRFGTLVADLNADDEIDPERCAYLQSVFRTIKDPTSSCADFKLKNTIALQITEGGLEDVHGGLWCDKPYPLGLKPGQAAPVPTGAGAGGAAGAGGGTVTAEDRVLAFFANHQGGPLVAGRKDDQHKVGVDGDGNPINMGHLALNTLIFNSETGIEDGTLKYDGMLGYPNAPQPQFFTEAPFWTQVFFHHDPKFPHETACKDGQGIYWWRAPVPRMTVTNGRPPAHPPGVPVDGGPGVPGIAIEPEGRNAAFQASTMEQADPVILAWPNFMAQGAVDFRNWDNPQADLVEAHNASSPIVARLEAFGRQIDGKEWGYTIKPGDGKYKGGTAPGSWILLRPETDLSDALAGDLSPERSALSAAHFGVAAGTFFAAGSPLFSTGGFHTGYRWGPAESGDLVFEQLDAAGIAAEVLRLTQNRRVGVREAAPVATMDVNGGLALAIRTVTSDTTLTADDHTLLVDATARAVVVNLPPAATVPGIVYQIKKIAGIPGNTVTIDPSGAETIDDAATAVLRIQYEAVTIKSDGAEWWIF